MSGRHRDAQRPDRNGLDVPHSYRKGAHRQRGAATVIVAVLFLVIVGYGAVVASRITATAVTDATFLDDGTELEFIGESGLERAFRRFRSGAACSTANGAVASTNPPEGPFTVGTNGATFTIKDAAPEGANCRVTVVAKQGDRERQVEGVIAPGGLAPFTLTDHFLAGSLAVPAGIWGTVVNTRSDGASAESTTCPGATCPGSSDVSFLAQTLSSGQGDRYVGYRQRTLSPALNTGTTGLTLRYSVGYKKTAQSSKATRQDISLTLFDSNSGTETTVWGHTTVLNNSNWFLATGSAVLPANRVYDRLRIRYDFQENKFNQISVWIDEIHLDYP